MISRFKAGLLAGLALSIAAGPALAEQRINCPQQQAKRMITNNLPSGWWTTPVVDRVTETKTMNIGGKLALVCVYGNAGSIQRNAPNGKNCRAVSGGFVCQ